MAVSTMKRLILAVAMATNLSSVRGAMEFGREGVRGGVGGIQRQRIVHGEVGLFRAVEASPLFNDKLEEVIDARSMMELSMSLSMSMSMGGPPVPLPPSGPPGPSIPTAPTPSTPSAPIATPPSNDPASVPTVEPTVSVEPSITDSPTAVVPVTPTSSPSGSPTIEPSVSFEPSVTAGPTTVDGCPNNGLSLTTSTDNDNEVIFLAVGYQVESTLDTVESFVDELGTTLINQAVAAILGCETDTTDLVFPTTLEIATCAETEEDAEACFIMETEAILLITGDFDRDVAVFDAYTAIQAYMNAYTPELIRAVLRLDYLSPLPIPVPPGSETSEPIPVTSNRSSGTDTNPWAIGAAVGSVLGGFVVAVASRKYWRRKRTDESETEWINGENPE